MRRIMPNDDTLDEAMKLYEKAFPHDVTRPVEDTIRLLRGGDYRLYVLEDDAGVAGAAFVCVWDGFVLLDYLVVEAGRRGHGLARRMFREVASLVEGRMLVFETFPANGTQAARWDAFCRSFGAVTLSDTYAIPSYDDDGQRPMQLMAVGTTKKTTTWTGGMLLEVVQRIYADVYGSPRQDLASDSMVGMVDRVDVPPFKA